LKLLQQLARDVVAAASEASLRSGVFQKLPPCLVSLVGIEACASSHYWARELQALGHRVLPGRPSPAWFFALSLGTNTAAYVWSVNRRLAAALRCKEDDYGQSSLLVGYRAAQKGSGSKPAERRPWVVSFVVGILIALLIAAGAFIFW
jgi:hypothetical protein